MACKCFICLSYRFSLNDHHYGLSAAGVALEVGAFFPPPSFFRSFLSFFSLQGVMQSNHGKRPGMAEALMCVRLLCCEWRQ